jgi:hypothetical protein
MGEISRYMDDGANWQAQAVLAYVRTFAFSVKDIKKPDDISPAQETEIERLLSFIHIEVGRYENCREQGYTFKVYCFSKGLNVAVFEHRNSDTLCLNVFDGIFINTPTWEDVWKGKESKWDYDYSFPYGSIVECGEKVISLLKEFVEKEVLETFMKKSNLN